MHNACLGDLLWGGSTVKASSDFYAVERVISKRKVRNTVGIVRQC